MLEMIGHRGPMDLDLYRSKCGPGECPSQHHRSRHRQPTICNEDESLWIVFNGEIFNYIELRQELDKRGHHFRTKSDTEIILHMYEEFGPDCLKQLNGQFAIAIWIT